MAYRLPSAAEGLSTRAWWRLATRLHAIASLWQDAHLGASASREATVASQLLGGEMGIVLAALLPELSPMRKLRKPSLAALAEGIAAHTDDQGMPQGRL
ncbi:MAG: hypothetical protein AAF790_07590, partial [Planctomycetota bacterium]